MNDSMMDVIEALNKANKRLVEALRDAHDNLEDMKGHIASITDPDPLQHLRPGKAETAVSTQDTDLPGEKIAEDLLDEMVAGVESVGFASRTVNLSPLRTVVAELPDNNAVHADRKERLLDLVSNAEGWIRQLHIKIDVLQNKLDRTAHDPLDRIQEAEGLANYHKGQTAQYQKNWTDLSTACRDFTLKLNRGAMAESTAIAMDDMLSKCEVESHNT